MSTNIVIIDVDLGFTVDNIISREVSKMTGAAAKELDDAIEMAKAVQRTKQAKEEADKVADNELNTALKEAYRQILSSSNGLPVSTVMGIIGNLVPNSSAFTIKMKSMLSQDGNKYILERKKVYGTQHYVLTPFNHDNRE